MDAGRSVDEQFVVQEITSAVHEGAEAALKELIDIKSKLETAIKTSNYDTLCYCNFHFPEPPNLVTAGGFNPSHDLSGNFLQDLNEITAWSENVFFSILPDSEGFWASFLWPRSYSLVARFVKDVEENYCTIGGMYAVALAHIENTFLRPSFWERLSGEEKDRFQFLAMMDVMHRDYARTKKEAAALKSRYSLQANITLRG